MPLILGDFVVTSGGLLALRQNYFFWRVLGLGGLCRPPLFPPEEE